MDKIDKIEEIKDLLIKCHTEQTEMKDKIIEKQCEILKLYEETIKVMEPYYNKGKNEN